jgi:acetyltransferase-like isoleucine patch superfamily enzyme
MKRIIAFLFVFLLIFGCKEKDNPKPIDSVMENSGNEEESNDSRLKLIEDHIIGNEISSKTVINLVYTDEVDFEIDEKGTITRYRGQEKDIVIPMRINGTPVTAIGNMVFYEYSLTSVVIPDTVTSIGGYAFFDNRLTSLTMPDSVTSIGLAAFGRNTLTSVTIPDSVTTIEPAAFQSCLLTSVTLPAGLTTINNSMFIFNHLTSFTIPDSVTTIGNSAFEYNALISVTIPDSVTSIGEFAFAHNRERTYTTDNRVIYDENLLNTVTIGANVALGEGGNPSFDNGFDDFYNANGEKAGTYVCIDDQWGMVLQ